MTDTFARPAYRVCLYATGSPDPSTQNAALIVDHDGRALGEYVCNAFPRRVEDTPERWERPAKYAFVEHAERNVIYSAARHGLKTNGKVMVCPWAACADCARAIIQAGIVVLYTLPRIPSARWSEQIALADMMLNEAGVRTVFHDQPVGVTLRRDGERIEV